MRASEFSEKLPRVGYGMIKVGMKIIKADEFTIFQAFSVLPGKQFVNEELFYYQRMLCLCCSLQKEVNRCSIQHYLNALIKALKVAFLLSPYGSFVTFFGKSVQ